VLKELRVQGFKSLLDVQAAFPRLTVLFGPNTAGKSILLDGVFERLMMRGLLGSVIARLSTYKLER
jgi:AAA15 family ATPase/GTPase